MDYRIVEKPSFKVVGKALRVSTQAVPAATWAVFTAQGPMPEALQNVWAGIWSEFFPAGQFRHGDGPDVEVYPRGDPTQPDYRSEVWVPVVPRSGARIVDVS